MKRELTMPHANEYFLKLFNGIADAVFISERLPSGIPGRYIEVNDIAGGMLGFSRDELLQMQPQQLNRVAIEDRDAYDSILDDLETNGKTLFKTELRHKTEQWIPVEISCRKFELFGDTVYFSVARDITLREKYEASIKNLVRSTVGLTGQECLEEIVKNLCSWLQVDGAGIGVLQDDRLDIRASFFDGELQPAHTLQLEDAPFIEMLKGQFCIYPENAASHFHNSSFLQLREAACFLGVPMLGHDGRVIGVVCAYSHQPLQTVPHVEELLSVIASRASAECERMRYVRELSRSEEMLRILFNSTAEAIVGIDLDGVIAFCNPSAVKILGYRQESDLIGRNFCKLINSHEPDNGGHDSDGCPFISAIEKGEKISREDVVFSRADGRQIPVEYWGHPMNRDNQLVGGGGHLYRHLQEKIPGKAVAAFATDGSHRHADRRDCSRFQQYPDGHLRLYRPVAGAICR